MDLRNNTSKALLATGIPLKKRSDCVWIKKIYESILFDILERNPFKSTFEYLLNECDQLMKGKVDWKQMTCYQGIGKHYDAESTYIMKTFSDEMNKRGTPVKPGERIDYVVVKLPNEDTKTKKGLKMRPVDSYDHSEPIDVAHYITNSLCNKLETIWYLGYKPMLDTLEKYYELYDATCILNEIYTHNPKYQEDIMKYIKENDNDPVKTIAALKVSNHKTRLGTARSRWNHRLDVKYRIRQHIIKKTLTSAIKNGEWDLCLQQLRKQLSQM